MYNEKLIIENPFTFSIGKLQARTTWNQLSAQCTISASKGTRQKKMWKIPHLGGGPDPGIFHI